MALKHTLSIALFFRLAPIVLVVALGLAPGQSAYSQTPANSGVAVSGDGLAQPVQLGQAQLAKLPHQQVVRPDHDGRKRTYSGVALYAVLQVAGAKLAANLPGKGMAYYVQARGADGYQAVFALAELDPAFAARTVLLADHIDGQLLSATAGPYQIIVPEEKKMGRCVRQVQGLRLVAAQP